MRQRTRDALLVVGVGMSLVGMYRMRRMEQALRAAAAVLTRDPLSLDALKDRAVDNLLNLPFDIIKR